jgi:hypothetical protein
VSGETGLKVEFLNPTKQGATMCTDFLTDDITTNWGFLSLMLTGILAGYSAAVRKHQRPSYLFPDLFGGPIL